MRLNNVIFLITFLVVTVGIALIIFLPPPPKPNFSIRLIGYTNDATGVHLANFIISNQGPATAYVYFDYNRVLLDAGRSVSFTTPAQTDGSSWRLSLDTDTDVGLIRHLNHVLNRTDRHMPYSVHSDWITEPSSNTIPATVR